METRIELGLLGSQLSHSFSKIMHEAALESLNIQGRYWLWEIPPGKNMAQNLASKINEIRRGEVRGVNVTIPYKEQVIPYLDRLTLAAKQIGAVNTIYWDQAEQKVIGDNTDAPAFWQDIQPILPGKLAASQALVLGAGGAARAVCYELMKHGWKVIVAARRTFQAQKLSRDLGARGGELTPLSLIDGDLPGKDRIQLVVNATSAGMVPDLADSPWPPRWQFPDAAAVYDLVYNPALTAFRKQAVEAGLKTRNGIGMLVEQAAMAFERWMGAAAPREVMRRAIDGE